MKKTNGYWGRMAPFYLIIYWNRALSSRVVFQIMIEKADDYLLKA